MVPRTGSIIELHLVMGRLQSLIMVGIRYLIVTLSAKKNQLGITPGTWHHYCLCWSYSSRTADLYHNGRMIGSMTTDSGRRLYTGGTIVLGQYQSHVGRIHTRRGDYFTFGGELFKLNMFSKKFTAAEVESMYQAGICSEAEKIHGSYRRLTWESILQQTRHGNVQLVNVNIAELCPLQGNIEQKLNQTQFELNQTRTELKSTRADLEQRMNQTQTEFKSTKADLEQRLNQTQTEFKSTKADLEQRLNQTQTEFKSTKADLLTCSSSSSTKQVLKFGNTLQDYVMFRPYMWAFTSQFSLCSWVRKIKTYNYPYWFHYATKSSFAEIRISDYHDGYDRIFTGPYLRKRNQPDIAPGTWYHYCLCWSYSSRTADVYYDGVKVGSFTTDSGRRLQKGGVLVLGQRNYPYGRIWADNPINSYSFGGELFKLNMFSKKFTAAEVKSMYQAGICSEAEKIHGSYRRLTWESILQQTRHGNVQLVNVDFAELSLLQENIDSVENQLIEAKGELETVEEQLNRNETEISEMRQRAALLEEKLNQTQTALQTAETVLKNTKNNLEQRLYRTQFELNQTRTEFKSTKADLEIRLNQTRIELKSTKADLEQRLNQTQVELKQSQAESEMYKSRISETEIFSANMSRELENTKTEFNLTKTQLRITKTELNLTKEDVEQIETNLLETRRNLETSLNETRADLKQVLDEQNRNKERQEKTNQDLDMLRVQLEKTKNRLNQTLAGLEEQLSDIPDCEVAAANVSRELAATKLELDRKEEELERLRGAMSGEDCLRETSCSHWDILYNHCYFNNVLTEEKFMSLNKVWEKLGKK